MSAGAPDSTRWSRRRWFVTSGTFLAAQLALIFYFGERPHELARAFRSRTKLYAAVDEWSARQIADLPALGDPTLFALASVHGFSGKAWLKLPLLDYRLSDWSEPPPFLALDGNQLARQSFSLTNELPPSRPAAMPVPDLLTLQMAIPPVNVRTASTLRIEGALQNLRLIEPSRLPSWPHEDLLSDSVVQLVANEHGETISTVLLGSSTSKNADNFALRFAASARFEPLSLATPSRETEPAGADAPPPQLKYSSGRMIFQWHTTPPPDKNTAAALP
jgi:hypothetical protein